MPKDQDRLRRARPGRKDNVVMLSVDTTLPLPPDRVLEQAKGELTEVLVIGWDADGDLDVRSSTSDTREVLWLLEKARHFILEQI